MSVVSRLQQAVVSSNTSSVPKAEQAEALCVRQVPCMMSGT